MLVDQESHKIKLLETQCTPPPSWVSQHLDTHVSYVWKSNNIIIKIIKVWLLIDGRMLLYMFVYELVTTLNMSTAAL